MAASKTKLRRGRFPALYCQMPGCSAKTGSIDKSVEHMKAIHNVTITRAELMYVIRKEMCKSEACTRSQSSSNA